jgi:demethylmenaquinone methyltransferase/2-methoxy-6-polyprenyl-1,4-benzoquinol methylase
MPTLVSFGYRQVTSDEQKRLVQNQFDPIARTYDLADALMSFGLDQRWRDEAIRLIALDQGDEVLDVCGGTGRLAKLTARRVRPGGRVTVCDLNRRMMEAGRGAVRTVDDGHAIVFVQADAEDLSFRDSTFHAVTIGLGLRNLADPARALRECLRVLKPGGHLVIFEFSVPVNVLLRALYHIYSFYWLPFLGRALCGTARPFRYLAESVRVFAKPEELGRLITSAGFSDVGFRRLLNGVAVVYRGRKAATAAAPGGTS